MKDFIDKTSISAGTPINRKNLMAMQGFSNKTISFNDDGSIVETNSDNETLTTRFYNDRITETFEGEKYIIKNIYFNENEIKVVVE